jgi:hypothetical protein
MKLDRNLAKFLAQLPETCGRVSQARPNPRAGRNLRVPTRARFGYVKPACVSMRAAIECRP